MHYHCEIIMPPTEGVQAAVTDIMAPFDENASEEDTSGRPFWDFWVIGGRWSGVKMEAAIGRDRIAAFDSELHDHKITVSGVQAGKPRLEPASQIAMVDALWSERFPAFAGACPLFEHSNDQYSSASRLPHDVARLDATPPELECARVIIAGPDWRNEHVKACFMVTDSIWNGCNHERTAWDKTLAHALQLADNDFSCYRTEWRATHAPQPDWLVVTVDYHS